MTDSKGKKRKPSPSSMSVAFKRAVAAAAMTKLMDGAPTEDEAARYVASHLGDAIFPTKGKREAVEALKEFRKTVMAVSAETNRVQSLAIARYHYDICLAGVERHRLGPKLSAMVLINSLLVNTGKKRPPAAKQRSSPNVR